MAAAGWSAAGCRCSGTDRSGATGRARSRPSTGPTIATPRSALSDSHTIPVTIAAEQGLLGELAYLAFVVAAIVYLVRRSRGDPVRSAVAAAFIALIFHTMLYADFLEDPTTWVLLGVGVALAGAETVAGEPEVVGPAVAGGVPAGGRVSSAAERA